MAGGIILPVFLLFRTVEKGVNSMTDIIIRNIGDLKNVVIEELKEGTVLSVKFNDESEVKEDANEEENA